MSIPALPWFTPWRFRHPVPPGRLERGSQFTHQGVSDRLGAAHRFPGSPARVVQHGAAALGRIPFGADSSHFSSIATVIEHPVNWMRNDGDSPYRPGIINRSDSEAGADLHFFVVLVVLVDEFVGCPNTDGKEAQWFIWDNICDNTCHRSSCSLTTPARAVPGVLPLGGERSSAKDASVRKHT
jgi:hypothetical protein